MNVIPYGDSALLLNFEQNIDEKINQEVIAWEKCFREFAEGIQFIIPAYCSLTVGFDTTQTSFEELKDWILHQESLISLKQENTASSIKYIPVCYEEIFALDKEEVQKQTNLSWESIIQLHTNRVYRVFMLGFLPGFPYLGKVPEKLYVHRKRIPSLQIPARSVGLAGFQTGIYPSEAPGGWQIIGRTPISIFNPAQENPFLLQAGEQIQFYVISKSKFEKMQKEICIDISKVHD